MKIAHIADLHIGAQFSSNLKRRNNQLATFITRDKKSLYGSIVRKKPDVLIVAGDIFDSENPDLYEVSTFTKFVKDIKKAGIDVLCSVGNHDRVTTDYPSKYLTDKFGIVHEEIIDMQGIRDTSGGKYNDTICVIDYKRPRELAQAIDDLAQKQNTYICTVMHQSALGFLPQIATPQLDSQKLMIAMQSCEYLALGDLHIQKSAISPDGDHIAAYPGNVDFHRRGQVESNFSFLLYDSDNKKLEKCPYEVYQRTNVINTSSYDSIDDIENDLNNMKDDYVIICQAEHPTHGYSLYKQLEEAAFEMQKNDSCGFCFRTIREVSKKKVHAQIHQDTENSDGSLEGIIANDSTISASQKELALSIWGNSPICSPKTVESLLREDLESMTYDQN